MNDSMDSSMDVRSTNKRLSRLVLIDSDFEENDDTREKRAQNKRNSAMLELGLTRKVKNNVQSNVKVNALSSEDITHHYGDCMKLASENKITSKNAFDLHLIDYLQDYMHSLQSFQTVSSSLDAGAKIYAVRVDKVHSNTYHMLSGCSGISNEPEVQEEPSVEDVENPEESRIRKPKKRNDNRQKMICSNIRKIRLTSAQIRSEVDPLFQSQAKKFDESGTDELRLNNLKILDNNYSLLLDFQSIVSTKCGSYIEDESLETMLDIGEFGKMLRDLIQKPVPISLEFEGFKFTGWDPSSEILNTQTAESFKSLMKNDDLVSMDGNNDYGMGEDFVENYEDEQIKIEGDGINVAMDAKMDEEDDNMLTLGNSKDDNGSSFFVSSVKEIVNSYMENYGEINENILGMWAGPDHWKEKAKSIKLTPSCDDRPKAPRPGKTIKEVKQMFPDWVLTRYNADRLGRLVNIQPKEQRPKKSLVSTQLTDLCLNKNIKKEYILPPRAQFVFKSINQLMNREISLVNKAIKKHAEQMSFMDLTEEQLENSEKNKSNNVFEVGPQDLIVVDDDGNVPDNDNDGGDGDAYFSDDDPYTGTSLRNCNFDDFGEPNQLTDNIQTREALEINYAKTAKRFNVKKLKVDILSYLTEKINIEDLETITKKEYPNVHMSTKECGLSNLLVNVDRCVSQDVSKELSVSIIMTCLLHLANELGLNVTNVPDFSDFMLGQGYSEYDLEQIALFGVGNELYKDTRKRKSLDSVTVTATPKSKRVSIFSDINDGSDSE